MTCPVHPEGCKKVPRYMLKNLLSIATDGVFQLDGQPLRKWTAESTAKALPALDRLDELAALKQLCSQEAIDLYGLVIDLAISPWREGNYVPDSERRS